ncbi:MAG: hypothetical protein H6687_02080 [Bacillales bacterium]|nr:hypothetical protein [Bacillales bacterium]
MKKVLFTAFFCVFLLCLSSGMKEVKAENYRYFQSIEFENEDVVMMDEWPDHQTEAYELKLPRERKMFGWYTYYSCKKEPFKYVADTIYYVKNDGTESIIHTFKYEESEEKTVQKTASGSLKVSGSQTTKNKFKYGLDGELEYEYEETTKSKVTETDQVKVTIAPNSTLYIKVMGEGYFYQGVAKKYFFWAVSKRGAFEYVIITTEYYSIEITQNSVIDSEAEQ